MIPRFNFYDIYGYFIPGAIVVLTIGLPFIVAGYKLGVSDWGVFFASVLLAYLVGHLLQSMATTALPASHDPQRKPWMDYSSTILNPGDHGLSAAMKNRLAASVQSWFGMQISVDTASDEAVGLVRQDAFDLARRVGIASSNYSEQFEGLYVMMRGLTVALWVGIAFTVGWLCANTIVSELALPLLAGSLMAVIFQSLRQLDNLDPDQRRSSNRSSLAALCVALFASGSLLGPRSIPPWEFGTLAVVALGYFAASFRFWNGYYHFAREFARSVWVQFAAEPESRPTNAES
jgi:hypothetical protein